MGKLFGTDGIRGVAGQWPLDADMVYRVGFCLAQYLRSSVPSPCILIGRDTRASGPWLESLLRRAILDAGGSCESCGVISTPAISILTFRTGKHAGIVISASHNPYQDNGIKVFSSSGMKFTDGVEAELERRIESASVAAPPELIPADSAGDQNLIQSISRCAEPYASFLRECIPAEFRLDGMNLVVDCAHGALSALAPAFLHSLGAEVHSLHCEPNGRNINLRAGALHIERLQEEVRSRKADLGIAFDGDADRAVFVDSMGKRRDGDDVLFVFARYMDFQDAPRIVVGTVMANLGLEIALQEHGIQLVRSAVGDRYVLEEMLRRGAIFGGEQSGHVILSQLARTGDGLLTALKVLEIMRKQKMKLEELSAPVRRFPQVLLDVPVREKPALSSIAGLTETEASLKEKLGPRSRILLRYSGTEKLARIMVEGEDLALVHEAAASLAALFDNLRP